MTTPTTTSTMKTSQKLIIASMVLSMLSIPFFAGSFDDAAFLIFSQSKAGFMMKSWTQYQAWGFIRMIGLLHPLLGNHYLAYRALVMGAGLAAFGVLAAICWQSPLALLALAGLLWMPHIFTSFHFIRYDSLQLLIVALNMAWLAECEWAPPAEILGFLIGVCPLVSLSGVLSWAMLICAIARTNEDWVRWIIGWFVGAALFFGFFPIPACRSEMLAYTHTWGLGWLTKPGILILAHPAALWAHVKDCLGLVAYGNNVHALPLAFLLMVGLFKCRKPLCQFALLYFVAHVLFSASRYPVLLWPVLIVVIRDMELGTLGYDCTAMALCLHGLSGLLVTLKIVSWGWNEKSPAMYFRHPSEAAIQFWECDGKAWTYKLREVPK